MSGKERSVDEKVRIKKVDKATKSPNKTKAFSKSETSEFGDILEMISKARRRTYRLVNNELIGLYWHIGEIVSKKTIFEDWGESTVVNLSEYILTKRPEISGFSKQNIWRMKQFYETYARNKELSLLVREIPWTHNLLIMSGAKTDDAREFYIKLTIKHRASKNTLAKFIDSLTFERWAIYDVKKKDMILNKHELAILKDNYTYDFLEVLQPNGENAEDEKSVKVTEANAEQLLFITAYQEAKTNALALEPSLHKLVNKILKHIKKHKSIDADEVVLLQGKSLRSAQRLLTTLVEKGILAQSGVTKNRLYTLNMQ